MEGYDPNAKSETVILSVISGVMPGTIIQNQPISADGNLSIAYYTSMADSTYKPVYNWLAVDPLAHNDAEFQHGVTRVDYDVFEKCVNITFTEVSYLSPCCNEIINVLLCESQSLQKKENIARTNIDMGFEYL